MRLDGKNCVCLIDEALVIRSQVDETRCRFGDFTDMKLGCSLQQETQKECFMVGQGILQLRRTYVPVLSAKVKNFLPASVRAISWIAACGIGVNRSVK